MMVYVHDNALADEYVVSTTTLVVVEVCLSHVKLTSAYLLSLLGHN